MFTEIMNVYLTKLYLWEISDKNMISFNTKIRKDYDLSHNLKHKQSLSLMIDFANAL